MIGLSDIRHARILIVDDRKVNVLLLEQMLGGAGYVSVESTMNPDEVCQLHRKNRYDLILLDLVMPGTDGFQILEGTRTQVIENDALGNGANGFFVFASGNNSEDGNLLQRNRAVGNAMNGIAIDVTSIRNRVVGNTVTGHVAPFFDLLDMNPNCRRPANTWTGNTVVTKSPDCLR